MSIVPEKRFSEKRKHLDLLAHLRIHLCKLCGEVIALMKSGKSARETSGTPTEQPRLSTFVETSQLYEKRGRKWKELTESVTYFLAKDSQPMYNVEKPGFRTLLRSFDGRYKLPSRKYFSETAIPSLYSNERASYLKSSLALQCTFQPQLTFGEAQV